MSSSTPIITTSSSRVIFVNRASDIPRSSHWAVIKSSSITIPGDERSRTSPGHGYPERTESFIKYIAFLDNEDFILEMEVSGPGAIGIYIMETFTTEQKLVVKKR